MIKIELKTLLEQRHMTQAELARLTGIRPSTICDIYNNNSTCSFLKLEHIDKICSTLGCDIREIMSIK